MGLFMMQLMDLIGYDHFEVVGAMLENRQALVASVLENPAHLAHDGVCTCARCPYVALCMCVCVCVCVRACVCVCTCTHLHTC